ncbi:MAG: Phosphoheptose isomerase [candidate division WS2 bacterium]|nr:Phosphoheptose isomerase [Candidatus Psychracetigena formicireducens]
MKEFRKKFTKEYLAEIRKILDSMEEDLVNKMDKLASILRKARDNKNTIFIMGNGGSASTASHFVGDLSKGTIAEGFPRFKAVALTDNIPNMLAWANDVGYEQIFVEQLKNLMEPGDVVIGISVSGNSMNVIKAIEYANKNGGITIGLSGCDGGKLLECAQENIHVPSSYMQRVEDIHLLIEHLLTSLIREEQEQKLEGI